MRRTTLSQVEYTFRATLAGGSEINAKLLLSHVTAAIDECLEKGKGVSGDVQMAAACSFWHSLVGLDERNKATTEVLGWADTRSRQYSAALKKRFDEEETHNRTGAHFHSSFWPSKLMWIRREFPDVWSRTRRWLSFGDYVALKLFGEAVTSVSMASATGIFDQRRCDWDRELIRYLGLKRENLPRIADSDAASFQLNTKFVKRWPRLADADWFPAIGDGAADNIGAGCVTRDRAALMIGTSGAMRVVYEGEPPDQIPTGLWCYRVDRRRVIIGGALSDGGNLYRWLVQNLRVPKNAADEMRRRGAAAHGITFEPFFFGERSIGYREDAVGAILGLTAAHDAVDILQAAMESVAYRFADILKRIEQVSPVSEIVASGGALRDSPVWTQIIADVLGRDLAKSDVQESSLRGAALLALDTIEGTKSNGAAAASPTPLPFHPECHAAYNAKLLSRSKLPRDRV